MSRLSQSHSDYDALLAAVVSMIETVGSDIILPAFHTIMASETKGDGSVVTITDTACQAFVEEKLAIIDSSIAFLGEEMGKTQQMQCLTGSGGRFWCLDPLDGTTNFVAGVPVFGTSLALIENGCPTLACIHDPIKGETFTARLNHGAYLNGNLISASTETDLVSAVGYIDFKRLTQQAKRSMLTPGLYRSQRNIGTCALEWAWLAAGRGNFIVHGGEKVWDFAAGSLIASEAGCAVGDFFAQPLFPCTRLSSPILAGCNEQIRVKLQKHLHA
jgi:myo-inositol-1(or 4)-monophosphatase